MKPTVRSRKDASPAVLRPGPHLNGLQHGLRSGHVLLPGDNVAEFRGLRHRLFRLHQPRTIEEARCVETIAAAHWRIARCRVEQGIFKQHLGAVLSGDPDATGYLCDPDPHRLHHRATDCGLEEQRLEKSMLLMRRALELLQKQRTQNFTARQTAALEDFHVFLAEGEPAVEAVAEGQAAVGAPVEPPALEATGPNTPTDQPSQPGPANPATASADRGTGLYFKRKSTVPAPRVPKRWSRRQREAAARRRADG